MSRTHEVLPSSEIFGGLRDPADLVRSAAERAREMVGGDGVGVYVWRESSAALEPLYASDPHLAVPFPAVSASKGTAWQAFEQRRAILVGDYPNREHHTTWNLKRWLAVNPRADAAAGFRAGWSRLARFVRPLLRETRQEDADAVRHQGASVPGNMPRSSSSTWFEWRPSPVTRVTGSPSSASTSVILSR